MMDTHMIDVISQEQKEQYGDFSIELPVYKDCENISENLNSYFLGKAGNDEYYKRKCLERKREEVDKNVK